MLDTLLAQQLEHMQAEHDGSSILYKHQQGQLRSTTLIAHNILTNQYFSILFSHLVQKFFNQSLSNKIKIMCLKSSEETEESHQFLTIFTKLVLISSGNIHLQLFCTTPILILFYSHIEYRRPFWLVLTLKLNISRTMQ